MSDIEIAQKANMNRIIDRLEALDAKLDRLMEREAR